MANRPAIPTSIRKKVLAEFNHRCAICGEDKPQLPHIDGDPTNNDPLNLLPLCPNCHLIDQHNPTAPFEPKKLNLFRRFNDTAILSSKFHPLYLRLTFLDHIQDNDSAGDLAKRSQELCEFVLALAMGEYYAKRLEDLTKRSL